MPRCKWRKWAWGRGRHGRVWQCVGGMRWLCYGTTGISSGWRGVPSFPAFPSSTTAKKIGKLIDSSLRCYWTCVQSPSSTVADKSFAIGTLAEVGWYRSHAYVTQPHHRLWMEWALPLDCCWNCILFSCKCFNVMMMKSAVMQSMV